MMPLTLVEKIEETETGWIVYARYPYGNDPGRYGPVLCKEWDEVIDVLTKCSLKVNKILELRYE